MLTGARDAGLRQRPRWSETLAHPVRTFHTLRHLQMRQVVYRAIRSVQSPGARAHVDMAPVLLPRRPSLPANASAAFDGRTFSLLNRRLAWGGGDRWRPADADDLWIFNLHGFRYLTALDPAIASGLVDDWIRTNVDRRTPAWHPYPISQRVREWIEWLLAHPDLDRSLRSAVLHSIAEQIESLRRRLEFDVMGNHLLENAIALCWAGVSFAGRQANAWLADGSTLLARELRSQLLDDGSHQERSPMYQALLTEAVLRLAEVAGQSSQDGGADVCRLASAAGRRMLTSLACLVHPDGGYALLNDTAFAIAPTFAALTARFGDVGGAADCGTAWALPAAGYAGSRDADGDYLVFDGGPVGPDHQAGHGHADTLAFELSVRGVRVVTDTGVFGYAAGSARRHDRSTAAHNTIEIDGRDQAELWGAFRCARRVVTDPIIVRRTHDGAGIIGAYRGPGRTSIVAHRRAVHHDRRVVAVSDQVTADGCHRAAIRLHFAPSIALRRTATHWTFGERGRAPLGALISPFPWVETTSPYHPEFGCELERPCLCASIAFRDRVALKWWLLLR